MIVAILLATNQIHSVDEYESKQAKGKPKRKSKWDKEILEDIAALKDPTRKALGDSYLLLSGYRALAQNIQERMDCYCEPYYESTVRSLSPSEIDELQNLTDSCCERMQDFVRQVKESKWQQHA